MSNARNRSSTKRKPGAAAALAKGTHMRVGKVRMRIWRGVREPGRLQFARIADEIERGARLSASDRGIVVVILRWMAAQKLLSDLERATKRPTKMLAELAMDLIRTQRLSRAAAIYGAIGPGEDDKKTFNRVAKALDRLLATLEPA